VLILHEIEEMNSDQALNHDGFHDEVEGRSRAKRECPEIPDIKLEKALPEYSVQFGRAV